MKKMAEQEKPFDIIVEMVSEKNLGADLTVSKRRGTVVVVGCHGPATINPHLLMTKESSIVGCLLMTSTKVGSY